MNDDSRIKFRIGDDGYHCTVGLSMNPGGSVDFDIHRHDAMVDASLCSVLSAEELRYMSEQFLKMAVLADAEENGDCVGHHDTCAFCEEMDQ